MPQVGDDAFRAHEFELPIPISAGFHPVGPGRVEPFVLAARDLRRLAIERVVISRPWTGQRRGMNGTQSFGYSRDSEQSRAKKGERANNPWQLTGRDQKQSLSKEGYVW